MKRPARSADGWCDLVLGAVIGGCAGGVIGFGFMRVLLVDWSWILVFAVAGATSETALRWIGRLVWGTTP